MPLCQKLEREPFDNLYIVWQGLNQKLNKKRRVGGPKAV